MHDRNTGIGVTAVNNFQGGELMNEYCKRYLKHSWGSSPERKQLEKIYNAQYYQANKNRWVINRQRRLGNIPSSDLTSTSDVNDIIVSPFSLYDGVEDFNNSSEEGIKKAKKFIKDFWEAPAAIIEGAKAVGRVVAKAPRAIINAGKKFAEALSKTKLVKFLKESKAEYDKL